MCICKHLCDRRWGEVRRVGQSWDGGGRNNFEPVEKSCKNWVRRAEVVWEELGSGGHSWKGVTQNGGEFREQSCEAVRFHGSSYMQNLLLGSYSSPLLITGNFRRPACLVFTCNCCAYVWYFVCRYIRYTYNKKQFIKDIYLGSLLVRKTGTCPTCPTQATVQKCLIKVAISVSTKYRSRWDNWVIFLIIPVPSVSKIGLTCIQFHNVSKKHTCKSRKLLRPRFKTRSARWCKMYTVKSF